MGKALRAGAGHFLVLLFLTLVVLTALLLQPYYHINNENSVNISYVDYAGTHWRVMEVAVFNWLGLPLFRQWWQGLFILSAMITVGAAFSAYLFWLELARLLRDKTMAGLGGYAPGLLAAYLITTQIGHGPYLTDITGSSYRMATLFAFITLTAALRFMRTGRLGWWAVAILSYGVACISHSFSWMLGLMVLLLELFRPREEQGPRVTRAMVIRYCVMLLAPLLVVLIGARTQLWHLMPWNPGMLSPNESTHTLLLGRYIYVMAATIFISPLASGIPRSPGALEWVAEAALLAVIVVGLVRMKRGRGFGLLELIVLFMLIWFALTIPSIVGSHIDWHGGRHRFTYPFAGALLVMAYLAARLLALAGRLAPASWGGRRWMAGAAWAVILIHLPWSLSARGVARAVRTGQTGTQNPCPGLESCPPAQAPTLDELIALVRSRKLRCSDLRMVEIPGADLQKADMRQVSLAGAHLNTAVLNSARLQKSCGYYTDLRKVSLMFADMRGARFVGSFLNDANLTGADLRGASLRASLIQRAVLVGADMRDADVVRASLSEANLRDARLNRANLTWSDLSGADLRGADLRGASLVSCPFVGTKLGGTNLDGAVLCEHTLQAIDNEGGGYLGQPKVISCGSAPDERYLLPPGM